jgi:hypothetical protein
MFCDFVVEARYTSKPKSSKSGLGRYNRMRGQIVKHLHEKHRDELARYVAAFSGGIVNARQGSEK